MEQVQMSELNSLKQSNNRNSNLVYDKSAGLTTSNGTLSTPKEYLYFPSSCEGLEAVNSMMAGNTAGTIQSLQQRSGPSSSVEQLLEEPEDLSSSDIQYIPSLNGHHHHSHVHHHAATSQQPGQFRVSAATSATSTTAATRDRTYEVPFVLTKVCYIFTLSLSLFQVLHRGNFSPRKKCLASCPARWMSTLTAIQVSLSLQVA